MDNLIARNWCSSGFDFQPIEKSVLEASSYSRLDAEVVLLADLKDKFTDFLLREVAKESDQIVAKFSLHSSMFSAIVSRDCLLSPESSFLYAK